MVLVHSFSVGIVVDSRNGKECGMVNNLMRKQGDEYQDGMVWCGCRVLRLRG